MATAAAALARAGVRTLVDRRRGRADPDPEGDVASRPLGELAAVDRAVGGAAGERAAADDGAVGRGRRADPLGDVAGEVVDAERAAGGREAADLVGAAGGERGPVGLGHVALAVV